MLFIPPPRGGESRWLPLEGGENPPREIVLQVTRDHSKRSGAREEMGQWVANPLEPTHNYFQVVVRSTLVSVLQPLSRV